MDNAAKEVEEDSKEGYGKEGGGRRECQLEGGSDGRARERPEV
jgi:hypothetical protein